MKLIYPLDYLCEKTNFSEIDNINDMKNLISHLEKKEFKEFLLSKKDKLKQFVVLDEKLIENILCKDKILKIRAKDIELNWFYKNIFSDMRKRDGKIEFKPKIIYSISDKCKNANSEDLKIKLCNLTVLKVKYVSLKTLLKIIKKYQKEI